MTTKRGNMLWKRLEAIFLMIIMLIVSSVPNVAEAAITTGIQNVEDIDFSDFSNWRSGVYYYTNGKYVEDSRRICLNNYVTFTSDTFKAHITNSHFRILIRELNSSKSFLRSVTLVNGQEYEPGTSAEYLAISVYKYVNGEADMSYSVFEEMFEKGFVAELCEVKDITTDSSNDTTIDSATDIEGSGAQTEREDVEDIDFTDFSNWRSGYYHQYTGKYAGYSTRICLNDYVTFRNEEYEVSINTSGYHMLIREMDENLKLIKSYDLADGKTYTPSADTMYLAISIYKLSESGVTYATFKNLFANGFEAKLVAMEEEDDVVIEEDKVIVGGVIENVQSSVTVNGSSASVGKTLFYASLREALINGDTSEVDVSDYKVLSTDFYITHWPKLKEECYVEYHSGKSIYPNITMKDNYVMTFQYQNMDDDYVERLVRVKASLNEFLNMVDSEMSDLDKILLAHEYVVNLTEYKLVNNISYTAGGPLGNGYGVCMGYADAMMVLLHELGIETTMVTSTAMNHSWVYVELDGSWYHIDPTWADTKRGNNGKNMHRFLIRNDAEFKTIEADKAHYDWSVADVTVASTSTKYTEWYVHDVAGSMYYYDGMWYYWDMSTNSILCSDIEGKTTQIVYDGSNLGTITLNNISDGMLSYYIGSTLYYIAL